MLIKNLAPYSQFALLALLVITVSCASNGTGPSSTTAEVIHLTSPDGQPQASVHNPRKAQSSGVIVSTLDTQEPMIIVDTADGLAPDTPVKLSLSPNQEVPSNKTLGNDSGSYKVQSGDTLYSIAQQFNKDYNMLAIANQLDSNYTIFPGQSLNLNTTDVQIPSSTTSKPTSKPISTSKPKPTTPKKSTSTAKTTSTKTYSNRKSREKSGTSWVWPVLDDTPTVLRAFSNDQGESVKGVDIAGTKGDVVLATSDGIVVYAGNELGGYGNLIIISHGERHISAYAHNETILIKEEQKVKQGQKIALMGSSGTDKVKLFFQIRKDSQPIDPITYLPKR